MAVTLADVKLGLQDDLQTGVIDEFRKGFSFALDANDFATSYTAAGTAGAAGLADKIETNMKNFFQFECVGKIAFETGNKRDFAANNAEILAKAAELAGISSYDVTELYISDYSFSSLSYLLGEYDISVNDLVTLLENEKGTRLR